jgi:aspartate/methionine/tyrosine aminotransferase
MEAAGVDVVHMEVGEPDFDTRLRNRRRVDGLRAGRTHYTHSWAAANCAGHRPLARQQYGTDIDPETIIVTNGSSPALLLTFLALCDSGDEVISPTPGTRAIRRS